MATGGNCARCGAALSAEGIAYACWEGTAYCAACTMVLDQRCARCAGELLLRPRPPRGIAAPRTAPAPPDATLDLEIDRAGVEDLGSLAPLFDGYLDFYHVPAEPARSRSFLRDRLTGDESVIYLARRSGVALGFVQLYPLFSSTRLGPLWLLNDLYVRPDVRQSGVATQLLERSKRLAEETHAVGVELETAVDNPAQRLYAGRGWKRDLEFFHYSWERAE